MILQDVLDFIDEMSCIILFNHIIVQAQCFLSEDKVGMTSPG
uniref:Uncharacterized protein n=1 Tax=Arundo donax TaxID=35708 RepID=A0A0A9GHB6_ARUDO